MKKRVLTLLLCLIMAFCMVCPVALADSSETANNCEHDWIVPTDHYYSIPIPGEDLDVGIEVEQCSKCGLYKHTANYFFGKSTYYSLLPPHRDGMIPSELITYWGNKLYNTLGQNASVKQYETGGGSAGTGGAGRRPSGYLDDAGTPTYNASGTLQMLVYPKYYYLLDGETVARDSFRYTNDSSTVVYSNYTLTVTNHTAKKLNHLLLYSNQCYLDYVIESPPVSGTYYTGGVYQYLSTDYLDGYSSTNTFTALSIAPNAYSKRLSTTDKDVSICQLTSSSASRYLMRALPNSSSSITFRPLKVYISPTTETVKQQTNITINNNTWNGNIYQDNSTNLTYIYPQYTTINENNETVTNISENPIIYNNETKEYYTYDSVTNNYYYITYVTETPTPTPSPDPTPTPDPGTDPTPTPEPGGDTGDTTGILAVLVEIRDNMIQGFADLKATLVQGWADLSANFTLAIENLNVNIQNTFNKKFPDLPEPTPDPALPAPVEPSTGDKWSDDIVSGTSISGTVNAKAGDYVLATVSARSALTIPGSMTYLYKGNVFASNSANQAMSFAYQKISEDGTYTYTFKQATAERMYLSLIVLSDIDGLSYSGKYHIEVKSKTPVSVPEKSDGGMLVWGCSSSLWLNSDTSNSKTWITNPDDLTYIGGASNSGQSRQANFIDFGTGAVNRTFLPYENSADDLVFVVDAVEIIPKTITPSPSPSPSPTPDPGTDPTPAPTDKPSGGSTNNFWNFVFPGGNDDGTENGHKGILWALISLLIAVVTFVLGLGSAYSYVFPFLPVGLVTTIHICVLVLLLFAIIKFVRSFL